MSHLALTAGEFVFLPPICLAVALVTAAARRDEMREILRAALRSWTYMVVGIVVFMFGLSYFLEWMLPAT